jgi:hypothetical protein
MCVQEDLQQKEASKSNLQQPIRGQQLLKRSRKPGVIFFSVDPVALSMFFCDNVINGKQALMET